jgi:glycosyltransferase involved in cell wall biosynthesis
MPGIIPSTELLVIKPLLGLERSGCIDARVTLEWMAREKDLDWADVVVFSRNQEPVYSRWLQACEVRGLPLIYDLDDNFFVIPDDYDFKTGFNQEQIEMVRQYLRKASLVRVYSQRMVQVTQAMNSTVRFVRSTLDWSLIRTPDRSGKRVRVVYATSRVDDRLAALFMPAVKRFLSDYAGQVEMHFWGFNPPEMRGLPNVFFKPLMLNYDRYLQDFSRAGFDIGLAPLLDDDFHNSKTNTKYREYGAARVAGIYSSTELYRESVQPDGTGLLVENTEDAWYAALVRLLKDSGLRENIQVAAYEDVRANYSEENFEKVWLEHILWAINNVIPSEAKQSPAEDASEEEKRRLLAHRPDALPGMTVTASETKQSPLPETVKPGRIAQIRFQMTKAIHVLRHKNFSTFLQRTQMKLEQVWLLARIRWFKRL